MGSKKSENMFAPIKNRINQQKNRTLNIKIMKNKENQYSLRFTENYDLLLLKLLKDDLRMLKSYRNNWALFSSNALDISPKFKRN